jgi:hypothetical protein
MEAGKELERAHCSLHLENSEPAIPLIIAPPPPPPFKIFLGKNPQKDESRLFFSIGCTHKINKK